MSQRYRLSEMMLRFVQESETFFPAHVVEQGIMVQRQAYEAMSNFFATPRPALLQVRDEVLAGIPVRRYRPLQLKSECKVMFVHGGGWYLGSLDSHDSFCAALAHDCRVEVIAVDYRLAPEHPYPAALDDVTAVYGRLAEEGSTPPLLIGDSAGGNLVAALTLRCRRLQLPAARGQVLIYPALAPPNTSASAHTMPDAPLLDRESIEFCLQMYAPEVFLSGARAEPEIFPLQIDSFADLPEAAIIAAEYDPLVDDARNYAERLAAADVAVSFQLIQGMVHGGLRAVSRTEEGDLLYYGICSQVQRLLRD